MSGANPSTATAASHSASARHATWHTHCCARVNRSTPTMHRFLVISYDDDQQQVFFDFALAPDANRAKQTIQVLRPYAVAIDAFEPKELTQMATGLATCTDEEIVRVLS